MAAIAMAVPVIAGETHVISESETSTPRTLRAYGKPNQTRVWYNGSANRWDALVPGDGNWWFGGHHYIVADVAGTQRFSDEVLGDEADDRPDVFWDQENEALYVLASHPRQSEFWRVVYNRRKDVYEFVIGKPGAGIEVPGLQHPDGRLGGNSPATIFVSPNGNVWASVMRSNALLVQYSSDDGYSWLKSPLLLDDSVGVGVTTWSCFESDGDTYTGLFAGENGDPDKDSNFFYWYIEQSANPTIRGNWVNDTDNIPGPFGREQSDDHVSAAVDAAFNQYFAVKTENGDPSDPLIKLFKRTPAGMWFQFPVTNTEDTPEQSRPSIVIDEERSLLHIYANGAEIVDEEARIAGRYSARLETPADFAGATFEPLFDANGTVFTDVITPRNPVNMRSGIVVLAHNRSDSTIWFNADIARDDSGARAGVSPPQSPCRQRP